MLIKLKAEFSDIVKEDIKSLIDSEVYYNAKLTTNKLLVENDRNNPNEYRTLKNVKMIFDLEGQGILILIGKINCNYQRETNFFGGSYYVTNGFIVASGKYNDIRGVNINIMFTESPDSNMTTQQTIKGIIENPNFIFNVSQFDDFMNIFGYYKQLSSELNNNASFEIKEVSDPYYFVSVDVKDIYDNGELLEEYRLLTPVNDQNGVLKGHIISEHTYDAMNNQTKSHVQKLIDIKMEFSEFVLKKILTMRENLYASNFKEVNDKNADELIELSLVNLSKSKQEIILSVEYDELKTSRFLNLYDMGQKIKIDSIDESLKLINQGASGTAIQMIEYLIGETEMPNYFSSVVSESKIKYLEGLNDSQKRAFLRAVDGSPVTLIKGPPGTGKTHVINAITQYITKELHEKVVIASQTHIAIDNVLDKLMENYDLVIPRRITKRSNKYSEKEIDYTLYKTWSSKFNDHIKRVSNKNLKEKVLENLKQFNGQQRFRFSEYTQSDNYSVIGATTTTSAIAGKKGLELLKDYKWLIIDEVSKSPITEVLRYLPYVEKVIMVGDDYQLAPLLEFNKNEVKDLPSYDEQKFDQLETIYEKSVFADTIYKASKAGRLVLLTENYRSVKNVLAVYNKFYDDRLINLRETVKPEKVKFNNKLDYMNINDTFFVEVKGGKESFDLKSHSRFNVEEIEATSQFLKELVEHTVLPQNVSVAAIFPYAAQIERFTRENVSLINQAKKVFKSFDVDTVDAFQGKESDIVLVNTVVTDSSLKNFLSDFRRINVSVSRAKDKLIIFGNSITLAKIEMKLVDGRVNNFFRDIISEIKTNGKYIEYTNEGGLNHENSIQGKIKIAKSS